MSSFLPPVFRGKIPTTSGRLLLAAGVMLGLDVLLFYWMGPWLIVWNFLQVVALIVVLLFSPRRWVALLLMLPVCFLLQPALLSGDALERYWCMVSSFIPPLVGVFVAYPRPRTRWVYVEDEKD